MYDKFELPEEYDAAYHACKKAERAFYMCKTEEKFMEAKKACDVVIAFLRDQLTRRYCPSDIEQVHAQLVAFERALQEMVDHRDKAPDDGTS